MDVPVTVSFATADGSATVAGNDYEQSAGTLTFDGTDAETRTIRVPVIGDTTPEATETLTVTCGTWQPPQSPVAGFSLKAVL